MTLSLPFPPWSPALPSNPVVPPLRLERLDQARAAAAVGRSLPLHLPVDVQDALHALHLNAAARKFQTPGASRIPSITGGAVAVTDAADASEAFYPGLELQPEASGGALSPTVATGNPATASPTPGIASADGPGRGGAVPAEQALQNNPVFGMQRTPRLPADGPDGHEPAGAITRRLVFEGGPDRTGTPSSGLRKSKFVIDRDQGSNEPQPHARIEPLAFRPPDSQQRPDPAEEVATSDSPPVVGGESPLLRVAGRLQALRQSPGASTPILIGRSRRREPRDPRRLQDIAADPVHLPTSPKAIEVSTLFSGDSTPPQQESSSKAAGDVAQAAVASGVSPRDSAGLRVRRGRPKEFNPEQVKARLEELQSLHRPPTEPEDGAAGSRTLIDKPLLGTIDKRHSGENGSVSLSDVALAERSGGRPAPRGTRKGSPPRQPDSLTHTATEVDQESSEEEEEPEVASGTGRVADRRMRELHRLRVRRKMRERQMKEAERAVKSASSWGQKLRSEVLLMALKARNYLSPMPDDIGTYSPVFTPLFVIACTAYFYYMAGSYR